MRKALLVLAVCIFATVSSSFALTGAGTASDPYMVTTAADLAGIGSNLTASYKLANDVTATGTIAGGFTGTFDGNNKTVTVASSLFEWNKGTISDLNVTAAITATGAGQAVGAVAASNSGTITGCAVSGTIAAGYGNYVGAIAGETNGLIEWCSTDATITVTDAAFASALDMDNMTLVGGIAGYAYTGAEIASVDSEAAVTVSAQNASVGGVVGYIVNASVSDAIYATGTVSTPYSLFTGMSVGGIAGYALESSIAAVTFDATASVIGGRYADAGGIAGYTDASAISEATSAGSVMVGYYGYAGGIAGRSSSTVSNSYAAGTVASMETYGVNAVLGGIIGLAEGASALSNVHNNALIVDNAGGAFAGTVYGWNDSSSETAVYYNSDLAMGKAAAGYGDAVTATGLTIAQMAAQASFTGFDFTTVWEMAANYPVLQNAAVLGDTPGVVQTRFVYNLQQGYNWISFPILPEDTTLTTVIAEYSAQASNLDQINSASGKLTQFYNGTWYGTLATVEAGKMYTVKVNAAAGVSFGVDGLPVDENTAIALVSGWNWIGSTLQTDITVANALSGLTLTNLDQVNSPDGKIAQYYNGAWYGTLTVIQPGVGYKLKIAQAQELFFDGALAAGAKKAASDLLSAAGAPNWGETVTDQYMMDVYCYVTDGGSAIATADGSILTVWTPSGVLAGKFTPSAGPIQAVQFSGSIFDSKTAESGLTLKLYDSATGKYYRINETLAFVNNGALGSLLFPYEFADVTEMASYTVTFDAGVKGSVTSGDAVQTVYEDQDATAPTVTANSGWEFTGWDVAYTHITQDTTVTAQYQAAQVTTYTVTFNAGANGSIATGDAVQLVAEGASATAPTITAAFGWVFAGWDAAFDNITSNVTINAVYQVATYTVTFVAGDNGSITAGTAVQTITHGQAATAPTVTPNTGWNFTDWDTDFSSVTSNLTVTAQYSAVTFTVTFVAGANGSITAGQAVQTVNYGASAVAPTVTPNAGSNFTGWDVDYSNVTSDLTVNAQYSVVTFTVTFAAGANGSITAGQTVQTVNYGTAATAPTITPNTGWVHSGWDVAFNNVTSDLTVTAQYSVATYTVTFVSGVNGTISAGQAVQTVNHGDSALAPTITENSGWTFTGWDTDFTNVTSDLTVTAQYTEATGNTFTVTFVPGANGTITAGDTVQTVAENGSAVAPTVTASTGWTFTGWDAAFNNITANLTVTAQYSVATYTVTFDAGANGAITAGNAVQTVNHGSAAAEPTVTANTGWTFTGWNVSFSNITSDLTVTAQYSVKQYNVTFQAGAHGAITAGDYIQIVSHGSAAAAPSVTADTGWDFTGWDVDFTNVTSALTVTAQYSVTTFTVTFVAGNNGTITAGTAQQTVNYGTAASAPTVTPVAGFNFTGWDVDFSNVTSDLTVTAQYSVVTLSVTFSAGANGTITAGTAQQTVNYGTAAAAPTVTANAGWTFTGWDVAFTNVTSNITVTALYSAIPQYTVTFNAGTNGTVISGASQTVYEGEGVELAMLVPDNGFRFMGWYDGQVQYQASDFDSITADITVTALYQAADAPTKYSADFNNDRNVGAADLGVIANSWLYAQGTLAADTGANAFTGTVFGDIDGNDWVGLGDYGLLGQYWLQTIAEQFTYNLSAGYNWISFNLLPADTSINSVFAGLVATDYDTITSQSDGFATYYNGSWWGNLATIKASEKYVLKLASATTFTATGDLVSADTPIVLVNGWNWVGFTPQTAMSVTDAMANLTLFDGDQVKSSAGKIAEYYQGSWYGTLDTLVPGAGYRVKVALPQTFAYSGTPAPQTAAVAPTNWIAPVGMEFSMTLYAQIQDNLGNQIATADGSMLSAWASDGDILGVVSEVTAGPTGSLFAMTIWNDVNDGSEVALKAYDAATGKYYNVNDTVVFVDGGVEGSVFAPTVFASLEQSDGGVPSWVAPVGTEFSMTLYAQVEDALGAQIATANGSMLSAWNSSGAIAGVVSEVTAGPVGPLFAMTIFGDATPESGYTLKVYDATTDKTYDLDASIVFTDGDVLGSVIAPEVYTVTGESNGGAPSWVAPVGSEFSMSLYAQIETTLGTQIAITNGSMLSAWDSTGKIQGVVSEVTAGPVGQLFAMTIFGDSASASGYTLKVYDAATDTTYDIDATISFVDGDILGSVVAPQVYTVSASTGEVPGWTAPTGLQYSMTMYVQIDDQLGAQIATAGGSMLSAWSPAGSIAGVVKEVSDGPNGKLFALMLFSNNETSNGYKLKVFDGATGTTYIIGETFNFADGTVIGSVVVPQVYTATGTTTGGGEPVWVAPTGKQYSMTLYAEIQDGAGSQIATADGSKFSAWTSDGKIAGVVDTVTTGPNGQLFAITIWNDITPDTGIVLKAYDAAADTVYTIDTTIDFTDGNVLGSVVAPIVFSATPGDTTTTAPDWTHPSGLELYMLVYAQVVDQNGNKVATTSGSMLSAWRLNGECSGVVNDVTQGPNGYYFNLLIASNESPVEQMRFKVYDSATGMVYNVIETIDFVDGSSVGNLLNPQEYTLTVMNYYAVNFDAGAHGAITAGDTAMWVVEGGTATAPTITADSGYAFDGWDAALTNVQSDMTITAQYKLASYIVVFDAGAHGTITSGTALQSVVYGFPATEPAVTADSGWTFAGWDVDFSNVTSDLTVTAQYTYVFQDGSVTFPWLINTADDWKNKFLAAGHAGDNFSVTGTVDLTGLATADVVLAEPFTGTISGGTIKYALSGTGLDYVALIPVANGATITNVTFDVTVTGRNVVGGVIAYSADSLLENVTVTGTVTGTKYVGSLVGENRGTIRNCTSSVAVTGTEIVGGIVGTNRGLIEGTTFTGTVSAPTAKYVGQIAGANISGIIR